jgi:hypothetical protein
VPSQTSNFATASGWTNSANALAAGGGSATANASVSLGGGAGRTVSLVLDGATLPAASTITGLQLDVLWPTTPPPYFSLLVAKLKKNGTVVGNNLASENAAAAPSYLSLGGDGQLWGASWVSADMVGCDLQFKDLDGDFGYTLCLVDHVRLKVFYTSAAPAGAGANLALLLP